MKKFKIYHNAECSKSNASLDILKNAKASFEVINYLETPPSEEELDQLLTQLGIEPKEIVRTHEARYRELELDSKSPKTREGWLQLLVQNPILIERPIVTDGKKTVIGRPSDNVKKLLGQSR